MDKDKLERLIADGLSSYSIAKEMQCAQTTVNYWFKKYGLRTERAATAFHDELRKKCSKCNTVKEHDMFFYRKDGGLSGYCRACLSDWTRDRKRLFKLSCLDYKGLRECSSCGYNKCVAALDFHHIDDTKEFSISSKRSVTMNDQIREELDKCVVLCANCHREHHFKKDFQ